MKPILTLLTLFTLLGLAALASGCAAVGALPSVMGASGATGLEIHNTTDVRLQQANFIVTKANVVGRCQGFSLLGIITIVPAKFTTAMSRLYREAGMQPGSPATLANLIVEKNGACYILFSLPQISVSADVIEFLPATGTNVPPSGPRTALPASSRADSRPGRKRRCRFRCGVRVGDGGAAAAERP